MSITRREVLALISQLAAVAGISACARSAGPGARPAGESDLALLAGVAYDILPYPELPPSLYVKAAQQILSLQDTVVAAGLAQLHAAVHAVAWKQIADSGRLAVLGDLQTTPFFHQIRATTLQVLLRAPATYTIVGYGGPSIPYGGYLHRGFNDISWLANGTP